jgi:hypothetical protein
VRSQVELLATWQGKALILSNLLMGLLVVALLRKSSRSPAKQGLALHSD